MERKNETTVRSRTRESSAVWLSACGGAKNQLACLNHSIMRHGPGTRPTSQFFATLPESIQHHTVVVLHPGPSGQPPINQPGAASPHHRRQTPVGEGEDSNCGFRKTTSRQGGGKRREHAPFACFCLMISATLSLSRNISDPDLVFAFFCSAIQCQTHETCITTILIPSTEGVAHTFPASAFCAFMRSRSRCCQAPSQSAIMLSSSLLLVPGHSDPSSKQLSTRMACCCSTYLITTSHP